MNTSHRLLVGDARRLEGVPDASVHLVVTSPPYPMVAMWDAVFAELSPEAGAALAREDGAAAFEAMHAVLDAVWAECARVLVPGGLLCVNVGDAVRTLGHFQLYPNHARILMAAMRLGFQPLPDVLWRKPNNSPNKFMGSGMLPAGAYVTYEHEYILVLRKGEARPFKTAAERQLRRQSAFFWEERNAWFSDLWADVLGARQQLAAPAMRERSAAFPLEIPYRLIQMYACLGDTVLDPFAGTGTTLLAAAVSGRSSIGFELAAPVAEVGRAALAEAPTIGRALAADRLENHRAFVHRRTQAGHPPGHHNVGLDLPVVTRQEVELELWEPIAVRWTDPRTAGVELRRAQPPPSLMCGVLPREDAARPATED